MWLILSFDIKVDTIVNDEIGSDDIFGEDGDEWDV